MADNSERSIVLLPETRLLEPVSGSNRITAAMVHEALTIAKEHILPYLEESSETQYARGISCLQGYYGPVEYVEAAKWLRMAANRGHTGAQNNLGYLYQHGFGLQQSNGEAFRWYMKAAEGELGWGKDSIGRCYRDGVGVEKDLFQAYKWFQLAADQGVQIARQEAERLASLMDLSEYKRAYALYREASDQEQPAIRDSLPGADASMTSKRRAYFYHFKCATRALGRERRPLFWLHAKMCDSISKYLLGSEPESLPPAELPSDVADRHTHKP